MLTKEDVLKIAKLSKLKFNESEIEKFKEDLNKIFDRFYRLDEARTRQKGGNGMGLSIAKAIVDKHNAKISAETDNDNNFIMKVKFYRKK